MKEMKMMMLRTIQIILHRVKMRLDCSIVHVLAVLVPPPRLRGHWKEDVSIVWVLLLPPLIDRMVIEALSSTPDLTALEEDHLPPEEVEAEETVARVVLVPPVVLSMLASSLDTVLCNLHLLTLEEVVVIEERTHHQGKGHHPLVLEPRVAHFMLANTDGTALCRLHHHPVLKVVVVVVETAVGEDTRHHHHQEEGHHPGVLVVQQVGLLNLARNDTVRCKQLDLDLLPLRIMAVVEGIVVGVEDNSNNNKVALDPPLWKKNQIPLQQETIPCQILLRLLPMLLQILLSLGPCMWIVRMMKSVSYLPPLIPLLLPTKLRKSDQSTTTTPQLLDHCN
mmetsp:Transcript_21229/g.52239  ORF Transcript_21229/g.52239 Transcript_21229/m.52239 type:complete len:336 (-) Transcript_21229:545-1552(-)